MSDRNRKQIFPKNEMRRKDNDKLYPAIGRTGTPTKKKKLPTTVQEIRKRCDWMMWQRMQRNPRTSQRVPEPPEQRNRKTWTSKNADTELAKSRCSRQAEKRRSDKLAICAQIDECEAANWRRTRPQKTWNPPEQGAENAAKTETRLRMERCAAKIREVETWRWRTAQAVKVWHPQTEIWRERNSRDSRVAREDVLRTMRPRMRKIFKTLDVAHDRK